MGGREGERERWEGDGRNYLDMLCGSSGLIYSDLVVFAERGKQSSTGTPFHGHQLKIGERRGRRLKGRVADLSSLKLAINKLISTAKDFKTV